MPSRPTIQQEQALARRIARGDLVARDRLVLEHLWVVEALLRRGRRWAVEPDELRQEGFLALVEQAGRFRPDTGPFLAGATRAVLRAFGRTGKRNERRMARQRSLAEGQAVAAPAGDQDIAAEVRRAIAVELDEPERQALRARHGHERAAQPWRARRQLVGVRKRLGEALRERGVV